MKVKQISIFLENKSGRLAQVTKVLADNGINLRALSLADTADFGILRIIVNDVDKAYNVLKNSGYTLSETDVVAVEVPDRPGGLASILDSLWKSGLSVEYMYAFVKSSGDNAVMIFRFEDTDKAIKVLNGVGVRILGGDEVYHI
ncbi:MAG: ACT domain-containing protein [bacterium]